MGRPTKYNAEVARQICAGIMEGQGLRRICAEEGMPDPRTVFNWLHSNKKFFQQYARAREVQAELLADDIVEIADDSVNDFIEIQKKKGVEILFDKENVLRAKLRVDSRKWVASKLLPKKYGDRVTQEHTGPDGDQLKVTVEHIGAPYTPSAEAK